MAKSLKESVDGFIATDEDCNMSGKGWILDGSYNFIMDFLREWGIAPKDVKIHKGMTTLFNADGHAFGYVFQDEEVDIFVADKTTNWTWENHNPSTKRVKVRAMEELKESNKSLKESKLNKSDVKLALKNVLKDGEEFDIPFKYSDEWEFTDAIEDELDRQGFKFENSFRDNTYGSVEEYSDGLETVYVIMDRSLSSRGICVGLVTEL